MQKFYEDSIDWEMNPLYGWCEKNKKKDGSNYNIYTDGLKIYTMDSFPSRSNLHKTSAFASHDNCCGRRNTVLDQMRKAGYITAEECDSLQNLPLELVYHRVDHKEGLATYFREYLRGVMTASKPVRSNYRGWQMQKFYEDSIDWEMNPSV